MDKKKVFVTLFPPCENIHLIKDVGMIPFLMHQNHGYDSYIATYQNGDYPYLEADVKGLKLKFIDKKSSEFADSLAFIRNEAKNIDILQVFHFSFKKLILLNLFMFLKGKVAKTYIKLDANQTSKAINYTGVKRFLLKKLIKNITLISAETKDIVDFLNQNNSLCHKVELIPNGFYDGGNPETDFTKKKQFLTVSRLSDPGKSVMTLLEGFKIFCRNLPGNDWSFKLVGDYTTEFMTEVKALFSDSPGIFEKINFTGAVYDRSVLNKIYAQSAVFLFASLSESFGFVYLEALQNECFILTTPLEPAKEITADWEFASHFEFKNPQDLAKKMELAIQKQNLKEIIEKGRHFVYENYYWPKNVEIIYENLRKNILE